MEKTVYIKDNSGKLRYWSCREFFDGLEIEHGVVGGTAQFQYEEITEGKATRSLDEQIASRIESRCNKQLDKGYTFDIEAARASKPTNRLGFSKPMLAKKSEDVDMVRMMKRPFFLQRKLDGNRCLIHNNGERLIAYTRNGKEFKTLDHILKPLESILPVGCTLDGELYVHGVALQTIVSWAKKKQSANSLIQYHVYDMISEQPFSTRIDELGAILTASFLEEYDSITLVETTRYTPDSGANLKALLAKVRADNYEGLMFRSDYLLDRGSWVEAGYQDGKRSGSLIKLKEWDDSEFKVTGITASADGWAILHCFNPRGDNFTVSCPGEVPFKRHVLHNIDDYVNKMLTVKFAYWTKDNVPFHPVAIAFRDYE